ncbi:MAG TPA: transglutaminase domain-containing protein [Planosporangium sp.]|nr:transglutaminase domain-containing protein [Planosporangium sp.]
MTTQSATESSAADVLQRLVLTPADVARYDTELARGVELLRLDPELLAALADAGLPHVVAPDGSRLFDYTDLTNVGRLSGTGRTVPELAWRFLMRFAESPSTSWFEPMMWMVTVRPPGQDIGPIAIAVPDGEAPGVDLLDIPPHEPLAAPPPTVPTGYQDAGYQVLVRLTGCDERVDHPGVRAAFDEVTDAMVSRQVAYQAVAEPLRTDPHRAWRLGMADCVVASKVLAARISLLGLRVRVRRGYMLGLLGSDHTWAEVEEDGRWKALDPVFAHLASAAPNAAAFREACCGGRFNRLLPCTVPDGRPLITRATGEPLPLWALTWVSTRPWRKG